MVLVVFAVVASLLKNILRVIGMVEIKNAGYGYIGGMVVFAYFGLCAVNYGVGVVTVALGMGVRLFERLHAADKWAAVAEPGCRTPDYIDLTLQAPLAVEV